MEFGEEVCFPEILWARDTNRIYSFWGVELSGREVLTLWGRKTGLITVSLSPNAEPNPLENEPARAAGRTRPDYGFFISEKPG